MEWEGEWRWVELEHWSNVRSPRFSLNLLQIILYISIRNNDTRTHEWPGQTIDHVNTIFCCNWVSHNLTTLCLSTTSSWGEITYICVLETPEGGFPLRRTMMHNLLSRQRHRMPIHPLQTARQDGAPKRRCWTWGVEPGWYCLWRKKYLQWCLFIWKSVD